MCASCGISTHISTAHLATEAPSQHSGVAFAALRHGDFRAYFLGSLVSMMADNVEHVISYWVLYEKFHSPALAGFAVISHWLPFLLFSVYFGALADRRDCRRIIQAGQAMYMGVSLAWGALFLTDSLEVWHAVLLLSIHGMAGALWAPASQLIIHDIVGPRELQSAVRLNATSRSLGILLGPATGAALLLSLGPGVGIMVNALIYVPLLAWLQVTRYTGHTREEAPVTRERLGLLDALAVLRSMRGNRVILAMTALAGLSSLLVGNAFQAQMPEFAHDLGTDSVGLTYSLLLAANAAGAALGGLLLEGSGLLRMNARTAILCALVWCAVIAWFAAAGSYVLALVLLFVGGVFNLAFTSMAMTLVQLLAPPSQRGRIVGVFNMSQQGLRTGSGFTVGVLGSVIGIHWALGLSAAALFVIVAGLLWWLEAGPTVRPPLVAEPALRDDRALAHALADRR